MPDPILELDNVDVRLAGVSIMRHIALNVGAGECVGLTGPNGAGKTTTLRTIMGLVTPQHGAICFDGVDLAKYPAFKRAALGIGYSPEDRRLAAALSVHDNLCLPGLACRFSKRELKRRSDEIYDLLPQLSALRDRGAKSLSGGQQKIVALGRALMSGNKLLLLDEPFQGLAPALARDYGQSLSRLKTRADALSILVTESNPVLLKDFANRCYAIERGEVIAPIDAGPSS